ncbi:MAG: hypothetical protein JSW44_04680 [Candidatus Bathyarchaeota archaeon]|nr:MAG: hypothetical protein JSW44_04680 [Candidatus Bathyarchaeota archaeon]
MAKKYALLFIIAVLVFVVVNLSVTDISNSLTFANNQEDGVVDKAPGEVFTVKISFENTGESDGTWSVNIAFEDDSWSQVGTAQNLALKSGKKGTLTWDGTVPANATINSMARLVVYYDDSFKALDWWIRVVPGAELCIKSSAVE